MMLSLRKVLQSLVLCMFMIHDAGAENNKIRLASQLEDLREELRRLQISAPPVPLGRMHTRDVGYVVVDPGENGEVRSVLNAMAVERSEKEGSCWPFALYEDPVSHDCLLLDGNRSVVFTFKAEQGYDPEWVFRHRFKAYADSPEGAGPRRFGSLLRPSRVLVRGRFVLAESPVVTLREGAGQVKGGYAPGASAGNAKTLSNDLTRLGTENSSAVSYLKTSLPSGFGDPNGITADNPGFPPEGYRDYLYLQLDQEAPALLKTQKNVRSVARASSCTLFVFDDGSVSGFGYDPLLFDPCSDAWAYPFCSWFDLPESTTDVVAVAPDWTNYFLLLHADKHVSGWGQVKNEFGRGQIPECATNVKAAAMGLCHAVALREDGRVVAWGDDGGSLTNVPADVVGAVSIACGCNFTLAVLGDGRVKAWGVGGVTNVPASVSNAVEVAAGFSHALARLEDGSVIAWGDNYYGQTNVPVLVTGAVSVAAGWDHSMALLDDGTVVVWGSDDYDQGDVPECAATALGIGAVDSQSSALLTDGSAAVWGGWSYGGDPSLPISALGSDFCSRVLQVAFSDNCSPGILSAVVRAPEGLLDGDADDDGLSPFDEHYVTGTNPGQTDHDDDGLDDGAETIVPFLTLWSAADTRGVVLPEYRASQVTASGAMRAALLRDGTVVVFTGDGATLQTHSFDCGAVELDATDKWILARLSNGDVRVWLEGTGGVPSFTDLGFTDVRQVAGGKVDLVTRHADGSVRYLKENTTTHLPVAVVSSFCSQINNATKISSGYNSVSVLLASGDVYTGAGTLSTHYTFTPGAGESVVDVGTLSTYYHSVLLSTGQAKVYYNQTLKENIDSGVTRIMGDGDQKCLALLSDGGNATYTRAVTGWSSSSVTQDLSRARSVWWKRGCGVAVTADGKLADLMDGALSSRALDYRGVAVTPGDLARGIALACAGTCPTNADTDADGMVDGWEVTYGLDPNDPSGADLDPDGDGMPNGLEAFCKTNPFAKDTDGDGVEDGYEDSDGDGRANLDEYLGVASGQGPSLAWVADSDGDGVSDGPLVPEGLAGQVVAGPDAFPLDPSAYLDTDGDGLPDELVPGVPSGSEPPLVADDDDDNDGLSDDEELALGTLPKNPDTDGDGLSDLWEYVNRTNPLLADSDEDGLDDGAETVLPFLTLWDADDRVGRVFSFGSTSVVEVTASGSMRAARLSSGEVVVFSGAGTNLVAVTNDCGATDIDASDSLVVALKGDGDVRAWYEYGGAINAVDMGYTNAVEVSCGLGHFLVRFATGAVYSLKPSVAPNGAPGYFRTVCNGLTYSADRISAGSKADAALLSDKRVIFVDATTTAYISPKSLSGGPSDVAAGTNGNYVVLLTNGTAIAYKSSSYSTGTGVVSIAGGGCGHLLAVMSDGRNALFKAGGSVWDFTSETNRLLGARNIWWRRDCRVAAGETGGLAVISNAVGPCRSFDYHAVAVTPGGLARGIAAVCSVTCPTNSSTDGDAMPDGWELFLGFDPNDATDAGADADGDGLANADEYLRKTDPRGRDSDKDGMEDGWEVRYRLDPLDPSDACGDFDGDGLTNIQEHGFGSAPDRRDSDGDGLDDGAETLVPFLALWENDKTRRSIVTNCVVVQVAATDSARAALLNDGRVLVFTGSGDSLRSFTNSCGAVKLDASESLIVIRRSDGGVTVCAENGDGTVAFTDTGLSSVTDVSCGYRHLLALHGDGSVTCVTNSPAGELGVLANAFCDGVGANAMAVSAGFHSDVAILKSSGLLEGDVFQAGAPYSRPVDDGFAAVDISAGSNLYYTVLYDNGKAHSHHYGIACDNTGPAGVTRIAAGGGRDMLAVQASGTNAVFVCGGTSWNYSAVTNRLVDVRDLWWRRDSALAVTAQGTLMHLSSTNVPAQGLDFYRAAITPRGLLLGIAAACSGTCPTNADSDADGRDDGWESRNGFDPMDKDDLSADDDGDHLSNLNEFLEGTGRWNPDSDGDGLWDGWEVMHEYDPTVFTDCGEDPDGDGVGNVTEVLFGTDPLSSDTDGDGIGDAVELSDSFVTLWDADDTFGKICGFGPGEVVEVTASDSMRAALLSDGRVVVFAGAGAGLVAQTNDCGAVRIDATDSWIAAVQSDGGVRVWRETSGGLTNSVWTNTVAYGAAVDVSGGFSHLLARHANGRVSCVKPDANGSPVTVSPSFCSGIVNATNVCAGSGCDAVIMTDGAVRFGDALSTASTNYPFGLAVRDVAAGSNRNFTVWFATPTRPAYSYRFDANWIPGAQVLAGTNVAGIAAGGAPQMLAVLTNGTNMVLSTADVLWQKGVTNRLVGSRSLWWRRDTRMAVSESGTLLPLTNAVMSGLRLDYLSAAVTPGGLKRGISRAVTETDPTRADTDGDKLPDGWEITHGMDASGNNGADLDPDNDYDADPDWDGLTNLDEVRYGTDPFEGDTDGDGLCDGWEIRYSFNPHVPESEPSHLADADPDGDGLDNAAESLYGTNPFEKDSDFDGLNDGVETIYPFLTLWDSAAETGRVFTATGVTQVTASDRMRAALLGDKSLAVFRNSGTGLVSYETNCVAKQIDATDSWILALRENGRVLVCRESGSSLVFEDPGLSNVAQVSGGYMHALARHEDGRVSWLRPDASGSPAAYFTNSFCFAAGTNAVSVSAGKNADTALLRDGKVIFGDLLGNVRVLTNSLLSNPVEVSAGSNRFYVVRQANGSVYAFNNTGSTLPGYAASSSASRIAADGSRNMLAVLTNGYNLVFSTSALVWASTGAPTNDLRNIRHLWWRRDCQSAVATNGVVTALSSSAVAPKRRLDYRFAAVTPQGMKVGIGGALAGTDPLQPDSDGDSLPDGWEIENGLDASVDNASDADPSNDPDGDLDGDGLSNRIESDLGTSSSVSDFNGDGVADGRDTDGDGITDDVEFGQGSDPTDAQSTEAPEGAVNFTFNFGDHSGSHSEKYSLSVTPVSGDDRPAQRRTNRQYGATEDFTMVLVRGAKYELTLSHVSTDPNYEGEPRPDYDYTLEITSGDGYSASDPDGMLGENNESETFFASGKSVTLELFKLDIEQSEENVLSSEKEHKLKLTDDSVPGGSVSWTVSPSGLAEKNQDGASFTFTPSDSEVGKYTVTATATTENGTLTDTCTVNIIKTDPDTGDKDKTPCGCKTGTCKNEGPSLHSSRFLLNLGEADARASDGALYFDTSTPEVSRTNLVLLNGGTAAVLRHADGGITNVVTGSRLRTVRVDNIPNGIRLTVDSVLPGEDRVWEITNPGGDLTQALFVKNPGGQAERTRTVSSPDGWWRLDTLDGDGNVLHSKARKTVSVSPETVENMVLEPGQGDSGSPFAGMRRISHSRTAVITVNGVERVLREEVWNGFADTFETVSYSYVSAPGNTRLNGSLCLTVNADGSWEHQAYDTYGRVTARTVPEHAGITPPQDPAAFDPLSCAGVLVSAYTYPANYLSAVAPDEPRTTEVYAVTAQGKTPVAFTWSDVYAVSNTVGGLTVPCLSNVTVRAQVPGAAKTAAGNPVSVEVTCDDERSDWRKGVPVCRVAEDGLVTRWRYEEGAYAAGVFVAGPAGEHVRAVSATFPAGAIAPAEPLAAEIEVSDAQWGHALLRETRLLDGGDLGGDPAAWPLLSWSRNTYDGTHLTETLYSDGTSESQAWDCCRLTSRVARDGTVTEYDTFPADGVSYTRQVSLAALPGTEGRYPAAETYADGLGRLTNSLRSVWFNGSRDAVYAPLATRTAYPHGTEHASVAVSPDGSTVSRTSAATADGTLETEVRGGSSTETLSFPNGPVRVTERRYDPVAGVTNSVSRLTETAHAADGSLVETVSVRRDNGVWATESETVRDYLGRTVAARSAGFGGAMLVASNVYDSAGRTLLTRAADGSRTVYAYDELGKNRGAVRIGAGQALSFDPQAFTLEQVIALDAYAVTETPSWREESDLGLSALGVPQAWWECSASVVRLPGQPALTASVSRVQLTGLSPACLGRTVTSDASGTVAIDTERYDAATASKVSSRTLSTSAAPDVTVSVAGYATARTNALGAATAYAYDGFARQTAAEEKAGGRTLRSLTAYHADGTVASTAEVDGTSTNRTLYAQRQVLETPQGAYRVTVTDPLGNETVNLYASDGTLYSSGGAVYPTASAQDAEGRQTELRTWRDETGLPDVTRWFRDQVSGLVTNKVYADGKGPSYAYLPDGRMSSRLWARGVSASYGWQDTASGRVQNVDYSDGTPSVTNTYDLAGRLTRVLDGSGTRTLSYDAKGRVTAETNALAVITRRYDAQGLTSEFSVDNDAAIAYAYDDLKRLTNVSVGGLSFGCAYLPQTRMQVSASNSCGSGWSRSYEGGRNLIAAVTNFHGSSLIASYAYGNDALGRRVVRNGDTFAYNARSELTNATTVSADVYCYGYDGIGNLLFSAFGPATNTYAANALNQYTNILCVPASLRLDYDLDGNMLTNGVWAYAWDAENRLSAVHADGVPLVSNAYDYLGRRFRKISGAATRTFVYDGWNLCREVEASGGVAVTNIYIWGLDLSGTLQGAGGVGGLLAVLRNGTPYFPCYDANGNVTDYVDAGGGVVAHREYDPFGRTTVATGALVHDLHFWFSTKYLDEETGLYYYGCRYFSPELMRWLNRDTIGETGGMNIYGFVGNTPIIGIDVLGMNFYYSIYYGVGPADGNGSILSAAKQVRDMLSKFSPPNDAIEGRNCLLKIEDSISSTMLRKASTIYNELYFFGHGREDVRLNPNWKTGQPLKDRNIVIGTNIMFSDGLFHLDAVLKEAKEKVKASIIYPYVCYDAYVSDDNPSGIPVCKLANSKKPNPSIAGNLQLITLMLQKFSCQKCCTVTVK